MPKEHKHKWTVTTEDGKTIAVCECGAKMDEKQVQNLLNLLERLAD
jgi:hypothetical protein